MNFCKAGNFIAYSSFRKYPIQYELLEPLQGCNRSGGGTKLVRFSPPIEG